MHSKQSLYHLSYIPDLRMIAGGFDSAAVAVPTLTFWCSLNRHLTLAKHWPSVWYLCLYLENPHA